MNISCRTRARVPIVCERASAPAPGIFVRSSQTRSEAARLRSWISPRRSRRSSAAAHSLNVVVGSASAYGAGGAPSEATFERPSSQRWCTRTIVGRSTGLASWMPQPFWVSSVRTKVPPDCRFSTQPW